MKYKAYLKGLWAERITELFLRLKGYRFLYRRYKTPVGEVDLVMTKGKTLLGIEVKARSNHDHAFDSFPLYQQKRVIRALEMFQVRHSQFHQYTLRCDFVLLVGFKLCHIKGAWSL